MPEQEELRRSPEVHSTDAEAPEVAPAVAPEVAAGVRGEVAPQAATPEVSASAAAEQAAAESAEEQMLREVGEILAEDLREVYDQLPADRRRKLDETGDELVRQIVRAVQTGRLTLTGIHEPVLAWLQQLRRDVTPEFLMQTAKRSYERLVAYFGLHPADRHAG